MGKIVESLASGRLFDWKTHQSSEKVPTSQVIEEVTSMAQIQYLPRCGLFFPLPPIPSGDLAVRWAGEIILSVMQLRQERREHEG